MFNRFWWVLLVIVPIGTVAGFFVAAVVTYVMPRTYESIGVVQLLPQVDPQSGSGQAGPNIGKIKGGGTLARVVDNLDLPNRWAMDKNACVQALDRMVLTEAIRGTDLVRVQVRHRNPEEACELATGVIKAFVDETTGLRKASLEGPMRELRAAVREQEAKTKEKGKALAELIRLGSPDSSAARSDYERQVELLEPLKLKLTGLEIIAKSDIDAVVIRDTPTVPHTPCSPNINDFPRRGNEIPHPNAHKQ
jgi:hypothetical protein